MLSYTGISFSRSEFFSNLNCQIWDIGIHNASLLRIFYGVVATFFPIFTPTKISFSHRFYREKVMDFVFLLGASMLWGITALLVMGFERLDRPARGQS